jgi:hypothetical protein
MLTFRHRQTLLLSGLGTAEDTLRTFALRRAYSSKVPSGQANAFGIVYQSSIESSDRPDFSASAVVACIPPCLKFHLPEVLGASTADINHLSEEGALEDFEIAQLSPRIHRPGQPKPCKNCSVGIWLVGLLVDLFVILLSNLCRSTDSTQFDQSSTRDSPIPTKHSEYSSASLGAAILRYPLQRPTERRSRGGSENVTIVGIPYTQNLRRPPRGPAH